MHLVAKVVTASALALCVSACGPMYGGPDVTTAPNAANTIPQSPNSLPRGDQINAPFTPSTGTVFRSGY